MQSPKALLLLLTAIILLPLSCFAIDSHELDVQLQQLINQYAFDNQRAMGFSAVEMSVLIPNETGPRHYAVGAQRKDQSVPATTEMMVQYGSITKEYTSTLLIQLANQHTLSLDDTIGKLLPEQFDTHNPKAWPLHWGDATVAQLLNMTSGIPVSVNNPDIAKDIDFYHVYAPIDIINMAVNYENLHGCNEEQGCFKSGTQYFYSNTNYMIAGLIVEKFHAHESFANVMTENILKKVNPDSLYYILDPLPNHLLTKMIHGYYEGPSGANPELPTGQDISAMNLSWGNSAGALIGTTDALAEMTQDLFHDKFNSAALLTSTKYLVRTEPPVSGQPVTDISSQCVDNACYGLGTVVVYDVQLGNIWFYEGGTLGFPTFYMWIPKENVTLAISQNAIGNGDELGTVLMAANELVLQYLHPGAMRYKNKVRQFKLPGRGRILR